MSCDASKYIAAILIKIHEYCWKIWRSSMPRSFIGENKNSIMKIPVLGYIENTTVETNSSWLNLMGCCNKLED